MFDHFPGTKKCCRSNDVTTGQGSTAVKAVFTFDAFALVPEHLLKMVLLSDIGYSQVP